MSGDSFRDDSRARIAAICGALAIGSLALWLAWCVELDALVPGVIFDDVFFGRRWPPFVGWYFLADALLMGSVALLISRRPAPAVVIGFLWTSFVFAETLGDLPVYARDPHLLFEELFFVVVYAVLLVEFAFHGKRLLRRRGPLW